MTTFVTDIGLISWKYMPFGLKCASNTFQRVASKILEPHRNYVACYIDDICVKSMTFDEHLVQVHNVLIACCDFVGKAVLYEPASGGTREVEKGAHTCINVNKYNAHYLLQGLRHDTVL